ncbi:hypothetical protein SNEBB_006021 [Seison nebaliae]|nr:hypothetical protein SNEBB_006021 [Seison nebaliae]
MTYTHLILLTFSLIIIRCTKFSDLINITRLSRDTRTITDKRDLNQVIESTQLNLDQLKEVEKNLIRQLKHQQRLCNDLSSSLDKFLNSYTMAIEMDKHREPNKLGKHSPRRLQRNETLMPYKITHEQELYYDLMKNYEPTMRPVYHTNDTVLIDIGITLMQIFDVDEKNQVLTLLTWLDIFWTDMRLQWDPNDYHGIEKISIPASNLWTPDMVLYNSFYGLDSINDVNTNAQGSVNAAKGLGNNRKNGNSKINAVIKANGTIYWAPLKRFQSTCQIDTTYFPFDNQTCILKIGPWSYDMKQVDLNPISDVASLTSYLPNGEWTLLGTRIRRNEEYYPCCSVSFPDIKLGIMMKRRTLYYATNVIVPCLMLSILTLLVFWLPGDMGEKVTLGLTVLVAYSLFMLLIAENMPATSESVPLIAIFLTLIMGMTSLSVISAVIVMSIHRVGDTLHPRPFPVWAKFWLFTVGEMFIYRRVTVKKDRKVESTAHSLKANLCCCCYDKKGIKSYELHNSIKMKRNINSSRMGGGTETTTKLAVPEVYSDGDYSLNDNQFNHSLRYHDRVHSNKKYFISNPNRSRMRKKDNRLLRPESSSIPRSFIITNSNSPKKQKNYENKDLIYVPMLSKCSPVTQPSSHRLYTNVSHRRNNKSLLYLGDKRRTSRSRTVDKKIRRRIGKSQSAQLSSTDLEELIKSKPSNRHKNHRCKPHQIDLFGKQIYDNYCVYCSNCKNCCRCYGKETDEDEGNCENCQTSDIAIDRYGRMVKDIKCLERLLEAVVYASYKKKGSGPMLGDEHDTLSNDWHRAAVVLDRLLFQGFFSFLFLLSIVVLIIVPKWRDRYLSHYEDAIAPSAMNLSTYSFALLFRIRMTTKSAYDDCQIETKLIHSGQEPSQWNSNAVIPPISLSTTFQQRLPGQHNGYEYSRSGNPTRNVFEKCVAAIENGKEAFAFSSGLGATTTIVHLLKSNDSILASDDLYGGTNRYLQKVAKKFGINTTLIDMTDGKLVESTLTKQTKMVWLETPSNPTLKLIDIEATVKIVKEFNENIIVVVDNTFATPIAQQPLNLGADIVLHSATKYINGHSDVVLGLAVANKETIRTELRFLQNAIGTVPSPFDCYLVNRGMKTLHVRMAQHEKNAFVVAKFLESHEEVERVSYPGLESHPQHETCKKQMKNSGGMVTFWLKDDSLDRANRFFQKIHVFTLAESLGGFESLAEHPATMTHASVPADERKKLGISNSLIRLSVGLENSTDLINDLHNALTKSH